MKRWVEESTHVAPLISLLQAHVHVCMHACVVCVCVQLTSGVKRKTTRGSKRSKDTVPQTQTHRQAETETDKHTHQGEDGLSAEPRLHETVQHHSLWGVAADDLLDVLRVVDNLCERNGGE